MDKIAETIKIFSVKSSSASHKNEQYPRTGGTIFLFDPKYASLD